MKSFGILAAMLALSAAPAAFAGDSPPAGASNPAAAGQMRHGGQRNWGPRQGGRWWGGWRAPGGWGAYRRPVVGYILPRYWINPGFYIGNYATYGFAAPRAGYGWSRYYDDAVLTDRYGRVQDHVPNVGWDRYDRYDDGDYAMGEDYSDSYGYREDDYGRPAPRGKDRDGGAGGALIGGAVGAVAGSVIAGRGDRTAGALIGGGLGALAGAAADLKDRDGRDYGYDQGRLPKHKKMKRPKRGKMGYDYDYGPGGVTHNGEWQGTWTGRWNGGPTQSWSGTYEGNMPHWDHGDGRYPGAPYPHGGHSTHRVHPGQPVVVHQGGYPGYYGYGGEVMTIVVQSQPITTTTTTTTEEVVYAKAPVRKRYAPRKVWKPRPKPRCVCR